MERTPHAGQAGTVRSAPSRSEHELRRIDEFGRDGKDGDTDDRPDPSGKEARESIRIR
ncbi:hypothetical protein MBLL_02501 (plasmid) [Methylobacterium bullatum]|jgi:hypothetical protein|uniref:Uncharacterized protein n=1 Tax=Methylobacterium bullatum TaxID=570505 RepID=A0A679JQ46_9HYPH|nr:hypothetical protein MBLL_02501 [Methylobacterium bullatum]